MDDFFAFRKMITPVIIQVIFWIGVATCVILGLYLIIDGASGERSYSYGGIEYVRAGIAETVSGLLVLVLGPIVVRVLSELTILFFRMNETLTEIRNNTQHGA